MGETTSSKESTPDTFLATGNAERAFFSVCSEGNGTDIQGAEVRANSNYSTDAAFKQETISLDSKYSDNDDDKATSIKVVNEILGEIEIDHQRQQLQNDLKRVNQDLINIKTVSDNDKCNQNTDTVTSKNERMKHGMVQGANNSGNIARSLVVDIHIPPNDGPDNFFL